MPCEAGFERREDRGEADIVVIGFCCSGKAAVKVFGDFLAGQYADGGGEFCIECRDPVVWVHGGGVGGIKMGGLAVCVDAGIGAAGAVKADGLATYFLKRGVDEVLDGVASSLGLPTEVGTAIVGDGEFQFHEISSSQRFRISTAAAWSMMDF